MIYLEKVLVFHTSQLRLPLRMLRVGSQQILQGEIIAVVEFRIYLVGNFEVRRRIDRETQVTEVFLPIGYADLEATRHIVQVGHDVFTFKRLGSFVPGAFKRGK